MDSIDLRFDLAAVAELAHHAAESTQHKKTIDNHLDRTTPEPALIWTHDDGTYLTSSGHPALPDPKREGWAKTVRPEGWQDPATWHEISNTPVQGHDFCERLPLHEPCQGTRTLLDLINESHTAGKKYFVLTITPSSDDTGPGTMQMWFD